MEIGFGNLMFLAKKCWDEYNSEKAEKLNNFSESFSIGPPSKETVKCGCEFSSTCVYCCGSGWLTKEVKELVKQKRGY